jgi:hypothetical protein
VLSLNLEGLNYAALVWLGFDGGLLCGGVCEVAGGGLDDDAELFSSGRHLLGVVEDLFEVAIG